MTVNSVQPYRKPQNGVKASLRYTYCPPVLGNDEASSPNERAAQSVSSPPTIQTRTKLPAPKWDSTAMPAIKAGARKMPLPIIDPMNDHGGVQQSELFLRGDGLIQECFQR